MDFKDFHKIDFHAHIYPEKIAAKAVAAVGEFYHLAMSENGISDRLLENGRKIGCVHYIVHSVATTPKQVDSINRFIASECEKHPEFVGFATLHPLSATLESDIENIGLLGLHGVKIHPDFQKFALDSDEAIHMFKLIGSKYPVLIHTGDYRYEYSNPIRMARAMDAVPELTAIGAHFGGYTEWEDSRRILLGRENFYIDTSSALFKLEPQEAADMIREHGVERTFFGTDFPMWNHEEEYERFMRMPLTDDERKLIFHDNAKKFLKLGE